MASAVVVAAIPYTAAGVAAIRFEYSLVSIAVSAVGALLMPAVLLGAVPILGIAVATAKDPTALVRSAGDMCALGTAGGIAGALSAALWLLPEMGVSRALLFIATLLSALGGLSLVGRERAWAFAPVIACAALCYCTRASPQDRVVVQEGTYQTIRIEARGQWLTMWLDASISSIVDQSTGEPAAMFAKRAVDACRAMGRHEVLILGGAGNSIGRALELTGSQVTTVELDPLVVRLSADWFGAVRGSTIVGDARVFLAETARDFDCIIVDVFSAPLVMPSHLMTREFFALVRSRLTPSGVVLLNYIGDVRTDGSSVLAALGATMRTNFAFVAADALAAPVDVNGRVIGPFMIAASAQPLDGFLEISAKGAVITDDWNPVEVMMARDSYAFVRAADRF